MPPRLATTFAAVISFHFRRHDTYSATIFFFAYAVAEPHISFVISSSFRRRRHFFVACHYLQRQTYAIDLLMRDIAVFLDTPYALLYVSSFLMLL